MDLSYPTMVQKQKFQNPTNRQNFANTSVQKCVPDLRLRSWQCLVNVQRTFFLLWTKSMPQTHVYFAQWNQIKISNGITINWRSHLKLWCICPHLQLSSPSNTQRPKFGRWVGGRSREEVGAKKFPQEARRAASRGLLLTGPTITA